MNIFEKAIRENKITSETELKKLFWRLAKKIHPDVAGIDTTHEGFIRLKKDFNASFELLRDRPVPDTAQTVSLDKKECIDIFIDLLAGNFPVDIRIRNKSKMYLSRMETLNSELTQLGGEFTDLYAGFEKEMYSLMGKTTVSNQPFYVVKSYFYRFLDYTNFPNVNNTHYLQLGYDLVHGIFLARNMNKSILFLNWLVIDIVGKENLKHG